MISRIVAKNKFYNQVMLGQLKPEKLFNEIFDDFETELKAKDEEIERLSKDLDYELKGNLELAVELSQLKNTKPNTLKDYVFTSCNDCINKVDGRFTETCFNCKRYYGCYFEKKGKRSEL